MATAEKDKRTPVFTWATDQKGTPYGEFQVDPQGRVVTVTRAEAMAQIAIKAQTTARGVYLIYADPANPTKNHKYGNDSFDILRRGNLTEAARIAELKRAIREALIYDPWVKDVRDITVDRIGTAGAEASFTIKSIFDTEVDIKGVPLNG